MFDGAILTRKPEPGYKPSNIHIQSWLFPLGDYSDPDMAAAECNLADAMSKVAIMNGLDENEIRAIFRVLLRMLKSDSIWAK